jgi:UDP-GlcNAc:undecaprenyl-phosphate GlcNAc-1-phosphate transferase
MTLDYAFVGLPAVAAAALAGTSATPIARRLDLFDYPDGDRKLHRKPTPVVGGLMILSGVAAAYAGHAVLVGGAGFYLTVLLLASGLALLIGLADDMWEIGPWVRLLALGVVGLGAMHLEPGFVVRALHSGLFGFHQGLGLLAIPFTVVSLLALINALNMTDGVDGLFTSLALCYLALLAPWLIAVGPDALPFVLALAGALLCVLAFNTMGRLFMGDSGTYAIAVFIGLLAVFAYDRSGSRLPGELVALWFGVPVTDMIRLFAKRMMRGTSPFKPDRDHLHHHLQSFLPDWLVVVAYCGLIALPGAIVNQSPSLLPLGIALGVAGYTLALVEGHRRRASPVKSPAGPAMFGRGFGGSNRNT